MATMNEEKVLTINDGVYDGTFSIGEDITIMWYTDTNSFKKYYNSAFSEEDKEEYDILLLYDEWETFGTLIGWSETDIIIEQEGIKVNIPVEDISNVCS